MEIPVYVISLKRDIERREKISHRLNGFNIKFSFYDAIDSTAHENAEVIELMKSKGGHADVMTKGEIACTLSHHGVYKTLLNSGSEWAIILEDDVIISDRFRHVIDGINSESLKNFNPDNIYLLGGMKGLHCHPVISTSLFTYIAVGKVKLRRVTHNRHKIRRACCYLIHKNMCKKILNMPETHGLYRADSWKEMSQMGLINDFYFSEVINHPVVNITNSNLEKERLITSEIRKERSPLNKLLKNIRSRAKLSFFSLYR